MIAIARISTILILMGTSGLFFKLGDAGKQRAWAGEFVTGAPSPRDAMGLAPCSGKLYVFGGKGATGMHPL